MSQVDVIVVGAGMIGLASAFALAEDGLRVHVLDRAGAGQGVSRVAAGMLAPLAEAHDMPDELVRMGVESARAWPDFAARVAARGGPVGLQTRGTLLVAADRDQAGELEQLTRAHERLGLRVERLTVRELLRREPRVSPRVAGALDCPEDHAVDPTRACAALVRAVRDLGGEVSEGPVVERVVASGGRVTGVALADGTRLAAPRVVVAAGLESEALVRPFAELGLRPVKGQVIHLRGEALLDGVVRTPRVYLVPRDARLVLGASEEEMGRHDAPLAGVTLDLLYEAWRVLPGIYDLEVEALVVGHRPAPRDGWPVVRAVGPEGLVVAAGHHRHGILLAPWTAGRVRAALGG